MASKNIAGLDIGRTAVKLVEFSPIKKEVVTIAYLVLNETDWENEEKVFEKILEWLRKNCQSKKLNLAVSVPARNSILRRIPIPTNEMQVEKLITWELEQYLNTSIEQYMFDFEIQEGFGKDNSSIYTVAAFNKSHVEKYQKAFSTKGINLITIDLDIFAAFNTFEKNFPEDSKRSAVLMKVDHQGIDLLLVEKNQWTDYRYIHFPEDIDGDNREELIKSICKKLDEQYKELISKVVFAPPKKIFCCGELINDDELLSQIKTQLPLKWGILYSFQNVAFPFEDDQRQQIEETAPQCATALGLALQTAEILI